MTRVDEVLETVRLRPEPLVPGHAASLFPELCDPELYRFIPRDPPVSLQAITDRYRRLSARRSPDGSEVWLNWAVRLRDRMECVGTLEATITADGTAFVAYIIFARHQRRGYAREGLRRIVEQLIGAEGAPGRSRDRYPESGVDRPGGNPRLSACGADSQCGCLQGRTE
jgi:RimJ/RimL family protein N-acetyltransferase